MDRIWWSGVVAPTCGVLQGHRELKDRMIEKAVYFEALLSFLYKVSDGHCHRTAGALLVYGAHPCLQSGTSAP